MSTILDGVDQYFDLQSVTINGGSFFPCTFSCWMKTTDLTKNAVLVCHDDGSYQQNMSEFRGGIAGDYVAALCYDGAWDLAVSTLGVSNDTWHHVLVVFNSTTDRRVYLDGANKGTDANTCNSAPGGAEDIGIGCRFPTGTPSLFFDGRLAEVAIWDVALSDANAVTLAGDNFASTVEAGNLLEYWHLKGDANSDGGTGGHNLTAYNTPTFDAADHPITVATEVTISGTAGITFGSTANLTNLLSISGTSEITFGSTANLTGSLSLSGTASITFSSTAVLIFGPLTGAKSEKYKRRLIAINNDCLYYEDI